MFRISGNEYDGDGLGEEEVVLMQGSEEMYIVRKRKEEKVERGE